MDSEGSLYGSGHNKYGSLGLKHFNNVSTFTKAEIEGIEEVAAGDGFSIALSNKGELLTCGHA